ncbi:ubiquinone biosynthesis accessory factor UbiJ [Porticoccus sp.]|uniref:ubiquinone biosynthesis accessory factor UbiJ n=1 Tax=Porticoccus sp. TaxID=2024853 RepID=UPI003F69860F
MFDFLKRNPLLALHGSALMAVETAVNSALKYDPATQKAIGEVSGQALEINCTLPPLSFYVIFEEDRISLLSRYDGAANTTLRGTALSLAALATNGEDKVSFYGTGVEVQGDHDLLRQIRRILKHLDVDWEAALAKLIGDVPAHLVGESLRRATVWQTQAAERASTAAAEFAQEEIRLTPSAKEVAHFRTQIRQLSTDVDRLAARIHKFSLKLDSQPRNSD